MVHKPSQSPMVDGDKCSDTVVNAFEHEVLVNSDRESNRHTSCMLHIVLNRSVSVPVAFNPFCSIWCVAVTYYGVILLRQHDLALSAFVGSVLNTLLSFTLKQILNQERPVSEVCSGPGMPSTHAQSISFAAIFFILSSNQLYPFQLHISVIIWFLIIKLLTLILILDYSYWMARIKWIFGLAYCCYYRDWCILCTSNFLMLCCSFMQSWLRVRLRYHTTSQVVAGLVVGSIFSFLWFCSCEELICSCSWRDVFWP
ncbi:lipid phosphate phosphatase epsilon 2, chloroplastic-like [Bidens hawaiensis]|uniref:lipid phosphate phosphatase epsilon 2, chloroplastic-like n=1 Tax=Bidens hawaiensis TaxID=980011 RepID=UPI00404B42F2